MGNCSNSKPQAHAEKKKIILPQGISQNDTKETRQRKQFQTQVEMQIVVLERKIKQNDYRLDSLSELIIKAQQQSQETSAKRYKSDWGRINKFNINLRNKIEKLKDIQQNIESQVDNNEILKMLQKNNDLNDPYQEQNLIDANNGLQEMQIQQDRMNAIFEVQENELDKKQTDNDFDQFVKEKNAKKIHENKQFNDAIKQQLQVY